MDSDSGSRDDRLALLLGTLAIERRYISPEQLRTVLAEQAREAAGSQGPPPPLSALLIARGFLTREQVEELLATHESRVEETLHASPGPAAPPRRAPAAQGTAFGKYMLLRELGRGGMGVVYLAVDSQLRRKVAIKMLLVSPMADAEETRLEEERFLREAQLSATLKHPHIVGVYEAGVVEGRRYLAAEYIAGKPMSEWRRTGSITIRQQVGMIRDVAVAVQEAHAKGIIHRDLKPQNVLVDAKNAPHVADFGLAKVAGTRANVSLTASGMIVGTPAYMSPEQAQGRKDIDFRADIWSLGVMLYEALTGRTPFTGNSPLEILMKAVKTDVPAPSSVSGAVDKGIENICLKALAKKPADRYDSALAFAQDLTRWLKGEEVKAAPVRTRTHAVPVKKKGAGVWIAVAAAAVALLVGAAFLLTRPGPPATFEAELSRARAALSAGDFKGARDLCDRILDRAPDQGDARALRRKAHQGMVAALVGEGDRHWKSGDALRALVSYEMALREEPSDARAREGKVATEAKLAKEKQSGASFVEPLLRQAEALAAQGRHEEARTAFDLVLKQEPANAKARAGRDAAEKAIAAARPSSVPAPAPKEAKPEARAVFDVPLREEGLRVLTGEPDGRFQPATVAGRACVRLQDTAHQYLYVNLDDAWAAGLEDPWVEIEYFDETRGLAHFDYDSPGDPWKQGGVITLSGSGLWKTARRLLPRAQFRGRQNGGADFRFAFNSHEEARALPIRRVAVHRGPAGARAKPADVDPASLRPGLISEYYYGTHFQTLSSRSGTANLGVSPSPRTDGSSVDFSARWTGFLRVPAAGSYTITIDADDGSCLWLGGEEVAEHWIGRGGTKATLSLEAGYHALVVELWQGAVDVRLSIVWSRDGAPPEPLPAEILFHRPADLKPYQAPPAVPEFADSLLADPAWKGAVNLMPSESPGPDVATGSWRLKDGELVASGAEGFPRLALRYEPPGEYDFRIVATRLEGTSDLTQILSQGGRDFGWIMGGWVNRVFVLGPVAGVPLDRSPTTVSAPGCLLNRRKYVSIVQVRKDRVTVHLNGKRLVDYPTRFAEFENFDNWRLPTPSQLGIGAGAGTTVFHRIEVREVTGKGRLLAAPAVPRPPARAEEPPAKGAAALIPLVDVARDAVAGQWTLSEGALVSDPTPFARIELPRRPPEEYDLRIDFTRREGGGDVVVALVGGGRAFHWQMGAYENTWGGFSFVGGADVNANASGVRRDRWLENGRRYSCRIQVRKDRVSAWLDGELVREWKTDYRDLSPNGRWKLRDEPKPGVGSHCSPTIFHRIELVEVAGPPPAAATRRAPPAAQALQKALSEIRESVKSEPRRRPEEMKALARKLREQAGSAEEPARLYALLQESADLAGKAGEPWEAFVAVDLLAAAFEVRGPKLKLDALEAASRTADLLAQKRNIGHAALALADEAVEADDYAVASSAVKAAEAAAKASGSPTLLNRVPDRAREVAELQAEYQRRGVRDHAKTLLASPDDARAAGVVGRFLAQGKGQWDRALPLLAGAGEKPYRELAAKEAAASGPAAEAAVGDAWWDAIDRAVSKARMKERALQWYRKAWPGLEGVERERVRERIASVLSRSAFVPEKGAKLPEVPKPWIRAGGSNRGAAYADERYARSGRASLALTNRISGSAPSDSQTGMYSESFPAQAGESYQISAWVITDGIDSPGDGLFITSFAADGKFLGLTGVSIPSAEPLWTQVKARATCPAGTARIVVECRVSSPSGSAWFDDVSLRRTGEGEEYLENGSFETAR